MDILQSVCTEQTIINSYPPACVAPTLYLTAFLSDTSPLQTTRAQGMAQTKRRLKNLKKMGILQSASTEQTIISSYLPACVAPNPYANDIL
ncbi:hypothetical protein OHD16_17345 [Sphingobacterium sp. ML3W]|uniref:hypothetical protein n=1 Tax=Sphingobacterium sp. ML3W TaxID=1538644 RepID=UPI00249A0F5B|nr:hypothetical protein [Sphingobacterium sp. ML3W]WFA81722.1 hypothetical protein OGI71_10485 [Sphingobacterium sp. ML3W]